MSRLQNRTTLCIVFLFLFFPSPSCTDPDAWEEEHNYHQPPEKIMDVIGIKAGMIIGEVGAGRGRYAVRLATRVGETGKVYANDISEKDLKYLKYRCKRDSIPNIETILGTLIDPKFPQASLDMAFMINTYHHLDQPVEIMKSIAPSLKRNASLVIVDHDPEKIAEQGWESHTTSKEKLLREAEEAGYELVKIETFLERDNIFILRLKEED